MQVGVITPRYPPTIQGGGEISVQLLAEQLAAHDDITAVHVFAFDGTAEATRENGVVVHRVVDVIDRIPEIANVQAALAIREYAEVLNDCDVFHAYNMVLNPITGYLGERYDVASVATLNSYDVLPKAAFGVKPKPLRHAYEVLAMPTTGRILRSYMQRVDHFITLSEASASLYRRHGFGSAQFTVVPNMLDPNFDPPERRSVDERFDLLYVGSLISEKGVESLVRALVDLPADTYVTVVGDGPEGESLRCLASSLGVTDQITFTGRIPYHRVREQYATSDAFIHPGVWPEPFGRTILEAMETGLPVLVSDIGGPAEIVDDPLCRFAPGTPSAIVEAVKRLRERNDNIGDRNRRRVQDRYTPERIITEILSLYRDLTQT
jgi:glycosyltransferase involved in cell wall biosynthesis